MPAQDLEMGAPREKDSVDDQGALVPVPSPSDMRLQVLRQDTMKPGGSRLRLASRRRSVLSPASQLWRAGEETCEDLCVLPYELEHCIARSRDPTNWNLDLALQSQVVAVGLVSPLDRHGDKGPMCPPRVWDRLLFCQFCRVHRPCSKCFTFLPTASHPNLSVQLD